MTLTAYHLRLERVGEVRWGLLHPESFTIEITVYPLEDAVLVFLDHVRQGWTFYIHNSESNPLKMGWNLLPIEKFIDILTDLRNPKNTIDLPQSDT